MSQITTFNSGGGVLPPEVPEQFTTDAGIAIPVANNLNVFGGIGINTAGAGDTVTINLDTPVSIANGGTNSIAMTNTFGVNYFDGTRVLTTLAGDDGELLIGATGGAPEFALLTSIGGTITFTPGPNSLNLETSGGSSITITGDTGGPITSGTFTFTGGTSGAVFAGAGTTFTESFNFLALPDSTSSALGLIKIGGNSFATVYPGFASANTFLGVVAGNFTNTGLSNTGIGFSALSAITTAINNTVVGQAAGSNLTAGASNTLLGRGAGINYTGAEASNICINSNGVLGESNVLRIGSATGTGVEQLNKAFIAGIDGINVGSTATVVTEASNQLGTAVITAGAGISVTPGANTITIAATAAGFTWTVITVNQTAAVNNGYFANKAGTLLLALPAASAVGDVIEVSNENTALGIQFTQAAGQQILIGNTNTTVGATGTLTTSSVGDTLKIVCKVANTIWRVTSVIGNWTPA